MMRNCKEATARDDLSIAMFNHENNSLIYRMECFSILYHTRYQNVVNGQDICEKGHHHKIRSFFLSSPENTSEEACVLLLSASTNFDRIFSLVFFLRFVVLLPFGVDGMAMSLF